MDQFIPAVQSNRIQLRHFTGKTQQQRRVQAIAALKRVSQP
jgi:hypothetical protein